MRFILTFIIGLLIGVTSGYYVSGADTTRVLVQSTPDIAIYGFQPFWLLGQTDPEVGKKTNTFIYFGLQLSDDGSVRTMNNDVEQEPGYTNLKSAAVKQYLTQAQEAGNTTSLAVQNANEESIQAMVENPEVSAQNLVSSVAPIMRMYNFTDLNLDIESFIEATPETQALFTRFVAEVSRLMSQEQIGTVSIDITPISLIKTRLTNAKEIAPLVDKVILMAYDFHYPGSYVAGPVAPLGGAGKTREFDITVSLQEALRIMPAEKLILGIPTYGYEWDTITNVPGSAAIPGTGKTLTQKQIENIKNSCPDCTTGIDELAGQPYLIKAESNYYRQIFYEDDQSVLNKILLARSYGLGGVAFWAMGYETRTTLELIERSSQRHNGS